MEENEITLAVCLWDSNKHSHDFSTMYTEEWVEKLYRGYKRNLTVPFKFICFVDRYREFKEPIKQQLLSNKDIHYGALIEPFKLDVPTIITGLDTVIVGNIDHLANYCFTATNKIAAPVDPYLKDKACNGVVLVPKGFRGTMWSRYDGFTNDMDWINQNPHVYIDDLFPGEVMSYKGHILPFESKLMGNEKIIYFHGRLKPHELEHLDWIQENWY